MPARVEILLSDRPSDGVLGLTLNRPEARNALTSEVLNQLARRLEEAEHDVSIRCVIITGGPEVFAAGSDVREMADKSALDVVIDERQGSWKCIRGFSKPLIAAVNGFCLGGGNELTMMCDIIVASSNAKFGQPESKLGLIPGAGATQRLTQVIGKARAMRYILTGDLFSAQEAFDWGLVSEVVEGDANDRALELAAAIAEKSPIAVGFAKQAVLAACDGALDHGFNQERRLFSMLFATEDRREGVAAFLEKRKPEFKGR